MGLVDDQMRQARLLVGLLGAGCACVLPSTVLHSPARPLSAARPRRAPTPTANLFPEDWMNRLGRATASKEKWALPQMNDSVGPGSVIFANPGSFDHYFQESMVLILEHGGSGTRGVLLNHRTPWKVDDMAPGALPDFGANSVFLGGDAGRDTMIMIHGESELPGAQEVGRGVYEGGVSAAVEAVKQGALPSDRFKFFYKTVEWLPNQLEQQIDGGVFRLIELSPAWLFGQSGDRMMWEEVRLQIEEEDESESAPADSTKAGVEAKAGDLASEASEAIAKLKQQQNEKKGKAEEKLRKSIAAEEHDEKVRALVEQIKAEKEAGIDSGSFSLGPNVEEEKARFEDALQNLRQQLDKRYQQGFTPIASPPTSLAVTPSGEQYTSPEGRESDAQQARAWLASQGITAPQKRPKLTVEELLSLAKAGEAIANQTATDGFQASAKSSAASASPAGIVSLEGYRVYKGNEQWRVRWKGEGKAGDTWEVWARLDTEELRSRAEQLREAH